jgi:hypothetical protein
VIATREGDRTRSHPQSPRRTSRRIFPVALGLSLLPLLISAVALVVDVGRSYVPTADYAYTELLTRDVGRHAVLSGLYSRLDWNHPGPALFYLLAIPYRLAGGASIGIHLGALLINGAAIAGIAVIARRRGGTPLLLASLVGCGLLVRAVGPDFVSNPWNPDITVLPYGLLVLIVWTMTCGDTWALPVAAGVASFCVQTHVGYAPMAIPLLLLGAGWVAVDAWRTGTVRALARPSALAAAVLVVMWLPPLIDQLANSPGNLSRILHYFEHPDRAPQSLAVGFRVVGGAFGLPPEWVAGARPPFGFLGDHLFAHAAPPPVLLVPFLLAGIVLWRRGASDGVRLVVILLVALGFGVVSVSRTIGDVAAYRLAWTWVLAMLASVVVGWTAWLLVRDRSGGARASGDRWLVAASMAALLVLAGFNSVSAARAGDPQPHWTEVMTTLSPPIAAALPARAGDVIIRWHSAPGQFLAPGVVLDLERKGIPARVDPDPASRFGAHRVHRHGPVRAVVTILAADQILAPPPDARVVSYWGTKTRQELAHAVAGRKAVDAARAAGTITNAEWARRSRAIGGGDSLAIAVASG